ncbi:hypothetical protein KAT51_00930 [bacterium]|nr:hypothetical protein [bacterium]
MNNLMKGVIFFLSVVGSAITTIVLFALGINDVGFVGVATTAGLFFLMMWFFLTNDPKKEEGGYE